MKMISRLWFGVALLALIAPVGILLPAYFKSGAAWGEWSPEELGKLAGYIPGGLGRLAGLWPAPIPGYDLSGGAGGIFSMGAAYIFSALVGVSAVAIAVLLIGKLITKKSS